MRVSVDLGNTHAAAIPGRYVHVEIPLRNGNYPCLVHDPENLTNNNCLPQIDFTTFSI